VKIKKNRIKEKYLFLSFALCIFILVNLIIFIPGIKRNIEQDFRILTLQPILLKSGNTSAKEAIGGIITTFQELPSIKRDYPILKINLNFENFSKIQKNKKNALKKSILFNPEKVPAQIIYKNKLYKAQIRLKGDLEMHWAWKKQLSLRIELEDGETILGMREFSITQHQARNFPYTELVSKALKFLKLDLVANYETFKIIINGENWGIMLAEEQYSGPYLERRRYIDSPIVKLSNEENWKFYKQIEEVNNNNLDIKFDLENAKKISNFQGIFEIDVFNGNKNSSIKSQHRISKFKNFKEKLYLNEINSENIKDFIDLQILAKVIASSFVFGDSHSLNSNNMRFYINPFSALLVPIPTDHSYMFGNYKNFIKEFQIDVYKTVYFYMPDIIKISLDNENFQNFYIQEIENIKNNLDKLELEISKICKIGLTICSKQIDMVKIKRNLERMIAFDKQIFSVIKYQNNLSDKVNDDVSNEDNNRYLKYMRNHTYFRTFSSGNNYVKNLTPFKIKLNTIQVIDKINCRKYNNSIGQIPYACIKKEFEINKIINPSFYPNLEKIKFYFSGIKEGDAILINYQINKKKFYQKTIVENSIFEHQKIEEKKLSKKFIKILKDKKIVQIKSGNWEIKKPLKIPVNYKLIIEAGTQINFSNNSYILVKNGSIELLGTKKNPIILQSKTNWNGILVLNSNSNNQSSKIQHTTFKNLNKYTDDERLLTGALNFYESDIFIDNSKFINNVNEDFLNIVNSNFVITDSKFSNIFSDAIDIDFGTGDLKNSSFEFINGDGFDTSGSKTLIINNFFKEIRDKAISIGEKSITKIENNEITNSNIGIAIKDGSKAQIINTKIDKSKLADIMSYNKKSFFGNSSLNISNTDQDLMIKIQAGSEALFNGDKIIPQKINVRKLYN